MTSMIPTEIPVEKIIYQPGTLVMPGWGEKNTRGRKDRTVRTFVLGHSPSSRERSYSSLF